MTQIRFNQEWVSRVTSSAVEDPIISSRDVGARPSELDMIVLMERVSDSDTVKEMVRRSWLMPASSGDRNRARSMALSDFLFGRANEASAFAISPLFRGTMRRRSLLEMIATLAWIRRISEKAIEAKGKGFDRDQLTAKEIQHLVHLSLDKSGPLKAIKYLKEMGVAVVVEDSLPNMRIDGASFMLPRGFPVIGLTLRYDRLDSFWFTLLHEIGHLILHLESHPDEVFIDSFEFEEPFDSEKEIEANAFAKDSFIPRDVWSRSDAFRTGTKSAILALSSELKIHPAIVAGRIRFEKKNYFDHHEFLGSSEVRSLLFSAK